MHIEIITTPNDALKESGFGSLKACNSVLHATQRLGHKVKLNVCESKACLDDVIKRKPELVILAVKYIALKNEDDIWLNIMLISLVHQEKYLGLIPIRLKLRCI